MITRQEAIRRLEEVESEIAELKNALEDGWEESSHQDSTQLFLDKCGGWQDRRSAEEIIAEMYALRTSSDRGEILFREGAT